jgi:hypothetical protein
LRRYTLVIVGAVRAQPMPAAAARALNVPDAAYTVDVSVPLVSCTLTPASATLLLVGRCRSTL